MVLVQQGLNGQPISFNSNSGTSVFLTNSRKMKLDAVYKLSHEYVLNFCKQCTSEEFLSTVEANVDTVCWDVIFILAVSKCQGTSPEDVLQRSQLKDLETYIYRQKEEYVDLDNTVWNTSSICRLLRRLYPKDSRSQATSTAFLQQCATVEPVWDHEHPEVQQTFMGEVFQIIADNGGPQMISKANEKSAIVAFFGKMA